MTSTRNCEIYIDGASRGNPGPAGVGAVFMDGGTTPTRQFSKYVGETTNNVAEYLALIYALQEAMQRRVRAVAVKTDSELLARQLNGQYKVKDRTLRMLHDLALHLMQAFASCSIAHVPREQNRLADRLAGQAATRRAL